MTKLELSAVSAVYEHLLIADGLRDWSELDNCLYNLDQLDDAQLFREADQQISKHRKKLPKCIMDHHHAAGKCMAVSTFAAARAINKGFTPENGFSPGERYILEHYIALAHLEKAT